MPCASRTSSAAGSRTPGPWSRPRRRRPERGRVRPSDVLVDVDRIVVGIDDDEAGGTGGRFVDRVRRLDAERADAALQLADVGEVVERVARAVPARVEVRTLRSNMPGN